MKRKFIIGKVNVKDLSDGDGNANPLIVKSMRTRVKDFIIGGPSFSKESVLKAGGFLSKRFW
jgi:hypothetical protein